MPAPLEFARENGHPIGYQEREYYRIQMIKQVGRGGNTREMEEPAMGTTLGADRVLGTGRGQKRGDG